jgi:transcriptional regulator with XRE-family HTH domain
MEEPMTRTFKELEAIGVSQDALRFRHWRHARKLTLDDCAAMSGVHRETISRMERGYHRRRPFLRTRRALEHLMQTYRDEMRPRRVPVQRGRPKGFKVKHV